MAPLHQALPRMISSLHQLIRTLPEICILFVFRVTPQIPGDKGIAQKKPLTIQSSFEIQEHI
jgi:hypothetical protein